LMADIQIRRKLSGMSVMWIKLVNVYRMKVFS